jgi:7-cyano-7-deazaguanine synthase in queuosine biosynthesis
MKALAASSESPPRSRRAETLRLLGVRAARGRCPWRFDFDVDGIRLSAFFRPPAEIADDLHAEHVAPLAVPILCDLAAQVRPRVVEVSPSCRLPPFGALFRDATGALLAEQDAEWSRRSWTPLPRLEARFAHGAVDNPPLSRNRAVLGFSGGKDSIVSLYALLGAGFDVIPVLLNEGDRTWQDTRRWIPRLRRLGLRPVSAYLMTGRRGELVRRFGDFYLSSYQIGWLTTLLSLCAQRLGAAIVCLGIESSANHTFERYRDRRVNHQYQKTTFHLGRLERFHRQCRGDALRIASPIATLSDTEVIDVLLTRVPPTQREFSSCGGANSQSKHCGRCEKCAFVFAVLHTTTEGRRVAKRVFRSNLLEDVELYRPWLDLRHRPPLACIGERSEVWAAFERLARDGSELPVVRKWRTCALRQRETTAPKSSRVATSPRDSRQDRQLAKPVERAHRLVRRWAREADR